MLYLILQMKISFQRMFFSCNYQGSGERQAVSLYLYIQKRQFLYICMQFILVQLAEND